MALVRLKLFDYRWCRIKGRGPDHKNYVTRSTTPPTHTGEPIYLRQNLKHLIESKVVNAIGPGPGDMGGLAEIKWIAGHADLQGISIAPHGWFNGILRMTALVQGCATMPDNLIVFEYPANSGSNWCDITEGFDMA